ncbi:MAG: response regulator transcription factor [Crocinitomicaceae bacterium]|nr:response regulator transcription factor [Crocinitomicaceae bacterium]MDP5011505.1 response regulator transcription factor [Crocinitomicaceae bacterium]
MIAFIADDHPIFRSGLKFLLETSFADIRIVEFDNGVSLLSYLNQHTPDIIIVDIDMPEKNGLEVCAEINSKNKGALVIVLTMYNDIEMLKLAFFNGARGYLVKDNTSEELVDCINYVLAGKTYIAKSIRDQEQIVDEQDTGRLQVAELLNSLTRTELKTLQLVSQKLSSKEIADLLFVSVKSVENYRSRICKKLNLDARNNSLLLWVLDNKKIIDGIK